MALSRSLTTCSSSLIIYLKETFILLILMANETFYSIIELPAQVLQETSTAIILGVPRIIAALLILVFGWFVAKISEFVIKKLLIASKVDDWIKKSKLKESLYNINIANTASLIVKYYILIIFLKEASVRAGLIFLSEMFDTLIKAVPELSIGAGIIILGLLFADFIRKKVSKMELPFNEGASELIYGVIMFFALVMALPKFGLTNTSLLEDSFKFIVLGISLGLSLAIGIGFGWAIKEGPAKNFFKKKK
ncbi:hypothetical protein GF352_04640 [archaeon]|nr:hypothetical protein [archaeon]